MSAMTVGMLSHMASATAPTGAETSLALLAEGLARRGHRVSVVVPGRWALAERLERQGVEVVTVPLRPCWLAYSRSPWTGAGPLKWLRWRLPDRGRGRLRRWLRETGPDVVHVNCLPQLSGALEARRAGLPVVWHVREILPPGARARWWASHLRRCAVRVVAVSEATAAWLRRQGLGTRIEVVPNGIEPGGGTPDRAAARASIGLPAAEGECVVGLVGQLLPHKGVIEFVRAAHRAVASEPTLRFLIAGGGPAPFVARVRAEIAAGIAASRIHLLGPMPSGAEPIAASDVVCLTTLTPDPLPRSVLESMQAARAVVAFRSGGAPELVEHERSGLLTEVGDVEGLARSLARLAADAALRRRLGEAAALRATELFSLDLHVERMERVLAEAAS